MKIILSLLLSLLLFSAPVYAVGEDRWLLAGTDSPNNNSWYIDSKTLKIHDNGTVLFWARVMLANPKYDITEIKIKYLLSADRLQLTKLEENGYSNTGETIWNNNVSKTISVIPGSGPEKLVLFVDDFIRSNEAAQKTDKKNPAETPEPAAADEKTVKAPAGVQQSDKKSPEPPQSQPSSDKTGSADTAAKAETPVR